MSAGQDLWVFGYGSLMWRPGFPFLDAHLAELDGFARSLCIYSLHHRGTRSRPGLVLGLDRGGSCIGMAYRVAAREAGRTIAYLREREQVTGAYREARLPVLLLMHDGAQHEVLALTYVAERAHPQYAGRLSAEVQARIVAGACGVSGINLAYLARTIRHLRSAGVNDEGLERVLRLAGLKGRSAERWEAMSALQARLALRGDAIRGAGLVPRVDRTSGARFQYRRNLGRWD